MQNIEIDNVNLVININANSSIYTKTFGGLFTKYIY